MPDVVQRFVADVSPAVSAIDTLIAKLAELQKFYASQNQPRTAGGIKDVIQDLLAQSGEIDKVAAQWERDAERIRQAMEKVNQPGRHFARITPETPGLAAAAGLTENQATGKANVGLSNLTQLQEQLNQLAEEYVQSRVNATKVVEEEVRASTGLRDISREGLEVQRQFSDVVSGRASAEILRRRSEEFRQIQQELVEYINKLTRQALESVKSKDAEKILNNLVNQRVRLNRELQKANRIQEAINANEQRQFEVAAEIARLKNELTVNPPVRRGGIATSEEQKLARLQAEQNRLTTQGTELYKKREQATEAVSHAQETYNATVAQNEAVQQFSGLINTISQAKEELREVRAEQAKVYAPANSEALTKNMNRIAVLLNKINAELQDENLSAERRNVLEQRFQNLVARSYEELGKRGTVERPAVLDPDAMRRELLRTAPLLERTMAAAFSDMGRRFTATLQFAISGALIFGVQRMVRELYSTAIEVERAFADISTALEFDIPAPRESPEFQEKLEEIRREVLALANDYNVLPTVANKAAFVMVSRFGDINNAMKATRAQLLAVKISTIEESETLRALTAVAEGFAASVLTTNTALSLNERLLQRETAAANLYMHALDVAVKIQQTYGVEVEDTLEGTARATETFRQMGFTMEQTAAMIAAISRELGLTGSQVAEKTNRWVGQLTNPQIRDQLIALAKTTDALTLSMSDFSSGADVWYRIVAQFDRLQAVEPELAQRLIQIIGQRRELESVAAALGTASQQQALVAGSLTAAGSAERRFEFLKQTISEIIKSIATGFEELAQNIERIGLLVPIKLLLSGLDNVLKVVNGILKAVQSVEQFFNKLHIGDIGLGDILRDVLLLTVAFKSLQRVIAATELVATIFTKGKGLILSRLGLAAEKVPPLGATAAVGTAGATETVGIGALAASGLIGVSGKVAHAVGSLLRPFLNLEKTVVGGGESLGKLSAIGKELTATFRAMNSAAILQLASGLVGKEVAVKAGETASQAAGRAISGAAGPLTTKILKILGLVARGVAAFSGPLLALGATVGAVVAFKSGLKDSAEALSALADAARLAQHQTAAQVDPNATPAERELVYQQNLFQNLQEQAQNPASGVGVFVQRYFTTFTYLLNEEFRKGMVKQFGLLNASLLAITGGYGADLKQFIPGATEFWENELRAAEKAMLQAQLDVLSERAAAQFGREGTGPGSGFRAFQEDLQEAYDLVADADKSPEAAAKASAAVEETTAAWAALANQLGVSEDKIEETATTLQDEIKRIQNRARIGVAFQPEKNGPTVFPSHRWAAEQLRKVYEDAIRVRDQVGEDTEDGQKLQDVADQAWLAMVDEQNSYWQQRTDRVNLIQDEVLKQIGLVQVLKDRIASGELHGDDLTQAQNDLTAAEYDLNQRLRDRAQAQAKRNVDNAKSIEEYQAATEQYIALLEAEKNAYLRQYRIYDAIDQAEKIADAKRNAAVELLRRQIVRQQARVRAAQPILSQRAQLEAQLAAIALQLASETISAEDKEALVIQQKELLAQAESAEIERLKAWTTLQAGVNDKLTQLNGELVTLNAELELAARVYGENSTEYFNIQNNIANVQDQIGLNQVALEGINLRLQGDVTDPMNDLVANLAEIIEKLSPERNLGDLEKAQLELDKAKAEAALYRGQVEDELFNLKFQFDTGALGLGGYLSALRSMRDAIDTTTHQGKELWQQINSLIEGLQGSANQAFNIPTEIRLPTLFEVRRALAADQLGVNYQDNRTQEVNVFVSDEVDTAQFLEQLDGVLGTSFAKDVRRSAPGMATLTLGSF